ncbi:Transglutaminase-like superfamily protein [Zhouia amylolytica]|uniref:Transglutaminase-like superfamily protein n=1 Tax=Zhouia amylolytica TaxID=376730 RepID=A0A1I6RI01_9FLAO|nr:DUF3857 domain-containing protein [Zhouia amylolytica]MCQ0110601.1 DUF3857 domain-containing protein [Zhouia amylolytica]SFS64210.1 Transglutaminase-like superfamily protein [Zhouia amylolytica]
MKFKITIVLILTSFYFSTAQDFDFGKVSKEEILEKVHPGDSSAPAAILFKKGRLTMEYDNGWYYNLEVEARVKIYTKEGYSYATMAVPLYAGKNRSNDEEMRSLKAITYNLENGKVTDEKMKKSGEFLEEVNDYWNQKKFTLPNVKEGSVIEYKYRIRSPYIHSLPEWKFQYDIPVNHIVYKTEIPEYLGYKEFNKGYFAIKRNTTAFKKTMSMRYQYSEPGKVTTSAHKTQTSNLEVLCNITEYEGTSVPKLKDENYVNNIDNYRSAVKHELAYTKMPSSPIEYFNQTWEHVTKTIYESSNFGGQLVKSGYFENDIQDLVKEVQNPMEKVALIYNYVKQIMNWNQYTGVYCSDGVKKAYSSKTGNVAEINLMLTAMLRSQGVNANPVLVSTRNHGVPFFPTKDGFNYVICAIEIDNSLILLDGTSKFSGPNILPEKTLNWFGRLVRENGSSAEVNLMPSSPSKSLVNMMVDLNEDGTLKGKYRRQLTKHRALTYRQVYSIMAEDEYVENIENAFEGIVVENHEVKNMEDLSKPIVESIDFKKEGSADVIGDKIYFSPLFFFTRKENPFKLEKREFPIDFSYPKSNRYMVNINIPEGYRIESYPEPMILKLPEDLGMFKFVTKISQNVIQLSISTDINSAIISSVYYDTIKEFYKQLVAKQTEKIVLTKV